MYGYFESLSDTGLIQEYKKLLKATITKKDKYDEKVIRDFHRAIRDFEAEMLIRMDKKNKRES